MTTTENTFTAAPLKGSWEAQLQEAERYARNFNDAALPIFDKIYTRLEKMPKARRMAADERLQKIFLRTALDYQGYLLMREEYDRALEIIDRVSQEMEGEEASNWAVQAALALHQAGRDEEALDRLRPQPGLPVENEFDELSSLIVFAINIDRLEEAESFLAHATQLVEETTELDEVILDFERAYIAMHRAQIALNRQAWDEGVAWFDKAVSWDPEFQFRVSEIYEPIAVEGPPATALRLIKQDANEGISQFFWQGLAHQRAGESKKAKQAWRYVTAYEPVEKEEALPFFETMMAHYYLGDPDRAGLTTVLKILKEEDSYNWGIMLVAGLGWAIHGNMPNAHSNLEVAMLLRRTTRPGAKYLPIDIWRHAKLLLDQAQLQEVAKYFDMDSDMGSDMETVPNEGEAEAGAATVEETG